MTESNPLNAIATADGDAPPPVLLPYQQTWAADNSPLKIGEKSRRIGLTWAEAADDVLIAAQQGGTNVFYIGPTQDMAFEFIEACGLWARAFNQAAGEVQDFLFEDVDDQGNTKFIKAYRIDFPGSGKRIVALSSRPTNLRGKQGVVVIDEAAFHPDLPGLLKAAMAMLLWGDKVRIISTHDGVDNAFNELIQEVRAGKRKGSVHRFTFREAVEAGLYRRVCLRRGIKWTPEGEAEWVADAYAFYGNDAAEELDVVPSQGGGAFLTMALIEARMSRDTPVVRGRWNTEFGVKPEWERRLEVQAWCDENLKPVLDLLDQSERHGYGEDFGRVSDLTVIAVGAETSGLITRLKVMIELFNCPLRQQEQILAYVVERLPRFRGGSMDATGNGGALAEFAADNFGGTRIQQVKLNEAFYLEHFPRFKGAMQDGTFDGVPQDREIRDDLRSIRVIDGVPKLPKSKTQKADGQQLSRHGDAAIACLMLHHAMTIERVNMEFQSTGVSRVGNSIGDYMGGGYGG